MDGQQAQIEVEKSSKRELEEFEKMHSKAFMYVLKEYEKWQKLKRRTGKAIQKISAAQL